jgi:ribosome-binding protein aMBF1 (putative translation factor)
MGLLLVAGNYRWKLLRWEVAGQFNMILADKLGIHVSQLKRYEAGTSQPTLDVLRKIALSLHVSSDVLLFDEGERGPDEDL